MWLDWVNRSLDRLGQGKKLRVPSWLPHPRVSGFDREPVADDHGQEHDWTMPFDDGSRLHVHEHHDGGMYAHVDRWDPRQSVGGFLLHALFESRAGPVMALLALGGVAFGAAALGSVRRPR